MLPVLKIAARGGTRVPLAAEEIAEELGLDETEREEMLPSGRQRILHNRIHWAKFYMSKAGLIDSPKRGLFKASQEGLNLLAQAPSKVDVELLKGYPTFREFLSASNSASPSSERPVTAAASTSAGTPEEQVEAAQQVLHSALRADLLQRILDNSPTFFERVIVDLLVGMGYGGSHENASLRLGRSGDGGVDGVVDEDRLGLDRIYIQAKRYAAHVSVGRPEIQGFVGSLVGFGASKGVFVTTSSFSGNAIEYTKHLPQRVILIDGQRLTDLMVEHDVGVRLSRAIAIKRLDEDFFADE
jgi:restriction system protein